MTFDQVHQTIAFCPWLVLEKPVTIRSFEFLPFDLDREPAKRHPEDAQQHLRTIFAGYKDEHGETIRRATLIVSEQNSPAWDFGNGPLEEIYEATLSLFLCALTCNEYFVQFGQKVNSSYFRATAQSFVGSPANLAYYVKRRDGRIMCGGYGFGEIVFSRPIACHKTDPVIVDGTLAESLNRAHHANSTLFRRITPALSFFQLANTDGDEMTAETEAILMAAAFEQLLGVQKKSNKSLGDALSDLLLEYGTKKTGDIAQSRASKPSERAMTDTDHHFVHREWIEELYRLRGAIVHGKDLTKQTWLWAATEHLVFGAFLFPLLVKLLLSREKHYSLTDEDVGRLKAVDPLLCRDNWANAPTSEGSSNAWAETVNGSIMTETLRRAMENQ